MATARIIQITPENTGLTRIKQTEAAAKKVTELLQEDLEVCHPQCLFTRTEPIFWLTLWILKTRRTTAISTTMAFITSESSFVPSTSNELALTAMPASPTRY